MNEPKCPQYDICDYQLEAGRPCMLHIYYQCKHFKIEGWISKQGLEKEIERLER